CTRRLTAGHYAVSLFNTDTQPTRTVAAQLRGRDAAAVATLASRAPRPLAAPRAAPVPRPSSALLAAAREHAEHLERDRARLGRLGAGAVARVRQPAAARASGAAAVPAVGAVLTLNAMYFDCARPTAVGARLAAV